MGSTWDCCAMGKQTLKSRKRKPGKRDTRWVTRKSWKQRAKTKKRLEKAKHRKGKKVDDLADMLAKTSTSIPQAAPASPGLGAKQSAPRSPKMAASGSAPTLSREELRKKLRAKIAGDSLQRTQGQEKGQTDSRGLKKRQPRSGMDMS